MGDVVDTSALVEHAGEMPAILLLELLVAHLSYPPVG